MTFAELDGWLAALRKLREPPRRFARRPGRTSSPDGMTWETKTHRSISLRRPRPGATPQEADHGK
ncbi:hypothetical protein [Castellaniella caeni]|uniref:hypothetical protein n=1 Tax=Castellaniella caeni TaxID=266123 RepID=UPI0011AF5B20|nr:hypothetical protein [Castellaniella caeni]